MAVAADETWYTRRDGRRNLTAHCPLAANETCPRYYLSQKHAAKAEVASLDLEASTQTRINEKWASSDVFASIEASVGTWFSKDGTLRGVDGFCPEVTARIFGLYCSSLRTYPDEQAKTSARKVLNAENTPKTDPRWEWMVVEPRHYTECHEFSVYSSSGTSRKPPAKGGKRTLGPKLRFSVLQRDGLRCVYCGKTPAESALHIDHKISVADGGTDLLENLVTACEECNLGKGARSVRDT